MNTIYNLLKLLNTIDLNSTHPEFKSFINKFLIEYNLTIKDLPININLIFSSDDISTYLRDYIININEAINQDQYIKHCSIMFKNDKYIQDIINWITSKENTKEGIKRKLKEALTK